MPEIVFILVSPSRQENIGAAARALKTMGFEKMRIVAPCCNHLGAKARTTAHGSNDVLEKVEVFPSLEEGLADVSLAIGSAAKKRNVAHDYQLVENIAGIIAAKENCVQRVAIVFGGEESGLSNHEMKKCDIISTIPMRRKYPSLNLGQAVMVYATYLRKLNFFVARKKIMRPSTNELKIVKQKAEQILEDVQMDKNGIIFPQIMERLMLLEKDDINLFHSFCKFYLKKCRAGK